MSEAVFQSVDNRKRHNCGIVGSELKSTIPRPSPFCQKTGVREVVSSSCLSRPVRLTRTRIPRLIAHSEKAIITQSHYPQLRRKLYTNVKAKVDTNRSRQSSEQKCVENSIELLNEPNILKEETLSAKQTIQADIPNNANFVDEMMTGLAAELQLKETTAPEQLQFLNPVPHSEEKTSQFESHLEAMLELWLQLLCAVISAKPSACSMTYNHCLSAIESTSTLQERIYQKLNAWPISTADPMKTKVQKVIGEQKQLACRVLNALKQYEGLAEISLQLKKVHEEEVSVLKDHLGILGRENKELNMKYKAMLEQCNQDKPKVEIKEMPYVEETLNLLKVKLLKLEHREKAWKENSRGIEKRMRIKNTRLKMQTKKDQQLLKQAKENLIILESELTKSNQTKKCLEKANKDLREDLGCTRATLDESIYKRNELREKLSLKEQILKDNKAELEMIKINVFNTKGQVAANTNKISLLSSNSKEDLEKQLDCKNTEIIDLNANLNHLKNTLKEQLVTENILMSQVTALQTQLLEYKKNMEVKMKKLQLVVRNLSEEKSELKKMIGKKYLKLGHKELVMEDLLGNNNKATIQDYEKGFIFKHQKTIYSQGFCRSDNKTIKDKMKSFGERFSQDSNTVEKEIIIHREKMSELYNLLEMKQMEVTRLERRLLHLQLGTERKNEGSSQFRILAKAFLPNEYQKHLLR